MWEFTYNAEQTIPAGQAAIFNGNSCGLVLHQDERATFRTRGVRTSPSCCASYQVTFNGNIALAEGATVGEISVALAIDGEPVQTSLAKATPAATGEYANVTCVATVPAFYGCCPSVALENTSVGATPADPSPTITMTNANITFIKTR